MIKLIMFSRRRSLSVSKSSLRPRSYPLLIRILSFTAFLYIVLGFLNHSVFHFVDTDNFWGRLFLSHRTEYVMILIFGIWRSIAEKDKNSRKRFIFLTISVTFFWWVLPELYPINEAHLGTLPSQALFPSLHMPGTITFFLTLILIFFFGRRIICGWFCPCVAVRETVGFPFRVDTVKSKKVFAFRHIKWIYLLVYLAVTVLILISSPTLEMVYSLFMMMVILPYFGSFLLSPLLGNRSYCRFICPYAATFGLLNKIGLFRLTMDREKCSSCGLCEDCCDMGIAIVEEGQAQGEVISIEECMGCGRCISQCSKKALRFEDLRDIIRR